MTGLLTLAALAATYRATRQLRHRLLAQPPISRLVTYCEYVLLICGLGLLMAARWPIA